MNTSKTIKRLALTLSILGIATNLTAHRQWMLPSTTVLSGEDQWISVEAAISNDLFFPNHHAINLGSVKAVSPSGKELELQSPTEGKIRSSFELNLKEQGTYRIFSGRDGMFASWDENGERKRKRGSAADFASMDLDSLDNLQLRKSSSRVETIVTCGAPTDLSVSGVGIEFEFISHPNDLFAGETAQFRVLLDGKPLADQEVIAVKGNDRFRDTPSELTVHSDEEGLIELNWTEPGRYWIETSARGGVEDFHGHEVSKGANYVLTVEVLPY